MTFSPVKLADIPIYSEGRLCKYTENKADTCLALKPFTPLPGSLLPILCFVNVSSFQRQINVKHYFLVPVMSDISSQTFVCISYRLLTSSVS